MTAQLTGGIASLMRRNALNHAQKYVFNRLFSTCACSLAGHSKWANIKHAKAAQDKKRALTFNRCYKDIVTAIRIGNGVTDLEVNSRLKTAINAARAVDMPKDKIEGVPTRKLASGALIDVQKHRY
eukprot:TRINITY_DN10333_c0_g1_i3.p3 TRINITY_DN10333_c0_g1~~TRINITY_DN10333_c0_g1_i3.p3  ORF type:complete len:126 (+),score=25.28 TRINITY_DN10333_c0_g1_i3:1609-1986(+)